MAGLGTSRRFFSILNLPGWALLGLILAGFTSATSAQIAISPQNDPRGTTSMSFANGKKLSIEYGRPLRHGRKIFGTAAAVVPNGQVWGPGDGAAMAIATEQEMRLPEGSIQRGSFSLYLLPSKTQWLLVVNQKTGQLASAYPSNFEFARYKLHSRALAKPVEQFTVTLKKSGPRSGRLTMAWDRTEVWTDFVEGNGQAHIHGEKEKDDE